MCDVEEQPEPAEHSDSFGSIIAVLVREYSELQGLQHAAQVEYRLHRTERQLRLEILRRPTGRSAVCTLLGWNEPYAHRLLRFLYENGVAPEHLREIVEECGSASVAQ